MSNHPDDIKARAEALLDEVEAAILDASGMPHEQLEAMHATLLYVLGVGPKPEVQS